MHNWCRDLTSGRLIRRQVENLTNNFENMDEGDVEIPNELGRNENQQVRSMRDFLEPQRNTIPSCFVYPPNAQNFRLKPGMIQLLPNFHGLESENPYLHLKEFEEICVTLNEPTCTQESIKLKLFPFSLKDKAKIWLNSLRPGSITTWQQVQTEFLKKFFPIHKTNSLKKQIKNFFQKPNEQYFQCWERFKDLLNSCPHHGFENWRTVSFFYEGLNSETKQFVEMMCNGEFLDKNPEDALEYLDHLVDKTQSWYNENTSEGSIRSNLENANKGKYHLSQEDDLNARITSLARKVESMELKKPKEVKFVQDKDTCDICAIEGHLTSECPRIPVFKELCHEQANAMSNFKKPFPSAYSETYNPNWRNHPNFSWRNDNHVQSSPNQNTSNSNFTPYHRPQTKSLKETLQTFMQAQTTINSQTSQAINEIKLTLSTLTNSLRTTEKGKFPAQPQQNPAGQCQISTETPQENVSSVTTLRSGKTIDKPVPPKNSESDSTSTSEDKGKDDGKKYDINVPSKRPLPAPFPQRLHPAKKLNHNPEIFEVLKQVKVNIPLLDAIKQVPSYAKFLKDLCTVKRKLNVQSKAFLTESVSSIIQQETPPKYKDPGCPTISCIIGNTKIEHALLDLGASVNLLPFSVYQQLDLGELKRTPITLQLADRSVKIPRGVVEDVLVQIDKFYFPVDFIVLDTHPVSNPTSQHPIILGRPFLATSNALINCRNGVLNLSFGNMTLELNVFNISKQPPDNDEVYEIDVNEKYTLEHFMTSFSDPLERLLTNDLVDEDNLECVSMFEMSQVPEENQWKPKFEQLLKSEKVPIPSSVQAPVLELKPLPSNLRYSYLGENDTYPVIISSKLNNEQEHKLLEVLRAHKQAIGWTISDIKGISPLICTHNIYLEENAKPSRQMQRRLNPNMKEVVRNEVIKLLDNDIIYPISDSKWVSPT